MSKARIKVKLQPTKKGSGTIVARVPIAVVKNDSPSGERIYQTKAQIGIRARTNRHGQPRKRNRF